MLRRTATLRLAALALAAPLALTACGDVGGDGREADPEGGIVPSEGAGGNEMEDDSGGG